jgi:hypothetical protein
MNKNFSNKKKTIVPNKRERDDFTDLEIEILKRISKLIKDKDGSRMEAYFLAWTTIEQFMLPRLIRFVTKNINIVMPKDFFGSHVAQTIRNYYFLSQDRELYLGLEKARKNRNKLVHEIYERKDWKSINAEYVKCLKSDIGPVFSLFQDRFKGKTKIPVLTLYKNGWNDGLEKIKIELLKGV